MAVLDMLLSKDGIFASYAEHPIQFIFTCLVVAWITSEAYTIFYNVFLHPLRSFPGPLASRATKLPIVFNMVRGRSHLYHNALHHKYGPIVRTEPDTLSFADGAAWKDIHGFKKAGAGAYIKDPDAYTKPPNGVQSILGANDEQHARLRRIFAHAFSDKALKEQEPLFTKYMNMLVNNLKDLFNEDPQAKINMVSYLNFTTFDIMGDLTFGEPLGLLEKSEYIPWVTTIFAALKAGTFLRAMKYFPILAAFGERLVPRSLIKLRDQHFAYSAERVTKRIEQKELDRPDIWHLVLKQEDEKALTLKEMHSNASLFMGAGTETTATELSGTIYYLLKNPTKMARLVKEIREAFPSAQDISMEKLAQIPYLYAVLEEGLRMYPPVPSGLPRLSPPEGTSVAGKYIPPGYRVSIHQYSTYRLPSNFKQPNSYIPERWLPSTDPESAPYADDDKAAMQPFSVGPRNCLGKNMAYHEMRLVLATLVWHFDLQLCEESQDWANQRVFILWEKKPLMLQLKVRADART